MEIKVNIAGVDPGFLTRGFKWLKGGFVLVLLPKFS